ncbi:hypothetical protein GUJ93_ZPchr0004g40397 [Zizania palustris]|uniref:Uncharacterized protein n=1 Tax=Zizania palustris TaxID=103762 RepID=A0A8J5SNW5_ZIZPA|nr:hypothetical protein GUJ93_ZPchr0004g40397 [Zizania palustris]
MSGKLDQQSVTATSKSAGKLRFSASGGGSAYRRASSGLLQPQKISTGRIHLTLKKATTEFASFMDDASLLAPCQWVFIG